MESNESVFTPREADVIAQLLQGKSNKQIALELGISNRAVEFHLSSIYTKLGVSSRAEAIIRLKDDSFRESVEQSLSGNLRDLTVDYTPTAEQNGDQLNSIRRRAMTKKILIGVLLVLGAFTIAFLLITSTKGSQASVAAQPTETAMQVVVIPTLTIQPHPTLLPAEPTTPVNIEDSGDHARFISETIADGTPLDPGRSITKTWVLLNDGTTTWGTDYSLVLTESSHPLGQTLGEPWSIPLPRPVPPGGQAVISILLAAPQVDSIYSATYQLHNSAGEKVPGDGGLIWFSVVVGTPTISAINSGISVQLQSVQKDADYTSATFCAQYPDTQDWNPYPVTLEAGGVSTGLDSYQLVGAKDPGTSSSTNRCFVLGFPAGTDINGTGSIKITIQSFAVDASTNLEENCTRAQDLLAAAHPGLSFTCGPAGSYYGSIQPAAGMTLEEAKSLVMDALEQRIYGPWVFEN
jgi:DNA-binding CsgD family transcriptional regulator